MAKAIYSEQERQVLLEAALQSIQHGINNGRPLIVEASEYLPNLREHRATFVTLYKDDELRGCIGTLEPYQALICDVAEQAYRAAFNDPRFPPVVAPELDAISIHIAVLGLPERLHFSSEQELIAQLEPGVDGLIVQDGDRRGTFLPAVWQSLPKPENFWQQLKRKAHLSPDYWSNTLQVWRYRTEDIH